MTSLINPTNPTFGDVRSHCTLEHLAGSSLIEQLHTLRLRHTQNKDVAVVFAGCQALSSLERLDLSFNPLGEKGLRALCESSALPRLTHLDLSYIDVPGGAAHWCEQLPSLSNLEYLCLNDMPLEYETLYTMLEQYEQPVLRHLELCRTKVFLGDCTKLADHPMLGELEHLKFYERGNYPPSVGLEDMKASTRFDPGVIRYHDVV